MYACVCVCVYCIFFIHFSVDGHLGCFHVLAIVYSSTMNIGGACIFLKYGFLWMSFPGSSDGKASACNAGDPGSIPVSGRSPGERNGNLLQYSCLENPMDRGAWQATVHGVAKIGHDWVTLLFTFLWICAQERDC